MFYCVYGLMSEIKNYYYYYNSSDTTYLMLNKICIYLKKIFN